jgi:hypothetical protein
MQLPARGERPDILKLMRTSHLDVTSITDGKPGDMQD